jgi:hypothetical protein
VNKERLLKLYNADKLADMIVKKDEIIASLMERLSKLEYVGNLFIKDKKYSFYIKEE